MGKEIPPSGEEYANRGVGSDRDLIQESKSHKYCQKSSKGLTGSISKTKQWVGEVGKIFNFI